MQRPRSGRPGDTLARSQGALLALVEAQVGPLLDVLPVALLVTSSRGDVLRVNPAAAALLGSADTLIGQPIDATLHGRHLSVRVTVLSHDREQVRLYVLHDRGVLAAVPKR